jgi:hypothetical protein
MLSKITLHGPATTRIPPHHRANTLALPLLSLLLISLLSSCSDPSPSQSTDTTPTTPSDTSTITSDDTPNTLADTENTSLEDTSSNQEDTGNTCATRLFGLPNENTGLSDDQCGPTCGCAPDITEGTLPTEVQIAHILTLTLAQPFPDLTDDPYTHPDDFIPNRDGVCAVTLTGTSYTISAFASEEEAEAAGAIPTHGGACGRCSPLQDLAVYMRNPDLTQPVRACGLLSLQEGDDAALACIRDLGFTEPCAQTWFYNTRHTREVCLGECLRLLNAPYHTPNGDLNACILCDEVKSGDVFKAVAGRTRRNTGLPSALCRPCDEVRALSHQYGEAAP